MPPIPVQLSSGGGHTCALFDNGEVRCWGRNDFGQLGQGHTNQLGDGPNETRDTIPPINLGEGRKARQVSAGQNHTCALLDNGAVKCWGWNAFGQLGLRHKNDVGDTSAEMGDVLAFVDLGVGRTAKSVEVGPTHTCALLMDGDVKCWGKNASGQLGQGHTDNIGDASSEMGENLPAVNLAGRPVRELALGRDHTCALLDNSTVRCWGSNEFGQLGQEHSRSIGDSPDEMGINLMSINLGTGQTVKQVVSGWYHNCVVLDSSDVKCWGDGRMGQLGIVGPFKVGNRPGDMGDNLRPINLGRSELKLGDPGFGDRNFRIGVKQLTAGQSHNCALLTSNYVKCWGGNSEGQLGVGDTRNRGIANPELMGDNLPTIPIGLHPLVTQINASGDHTCVLRVDNSVRCWGRNLDGELGLGHINNVGDNPGEVVIIPPRSIFSPSEAPFVYR